ncbi:MAG: DUF11 domain-containing protein [bacterium]
MKKPRRASLPLFGAVVLAAAVVSSPARAQTLSSASDQSFTVGDPATPIAVATVTDDAVTATITAANDLRIRVPAGFPMTWDATDVTPTIGGTAASKVSATVSYEDSDQTLVLDVITDFAPGDDLTIGDLSFAGFTAAASASNLELEVANDGLVSATDDKTVTVTPPSVDLAVVKTVDNAAPDALDTIVYTISLTNAGPDDATTTTVNDLLPAGVTFVSATATQGSYDDVTGIWTVGTVTTTAADTLAITATVDAGTEGNAIDNTASVGGSDGVDSNATNDSSTASLTVNTPPPSVDLAVVKTVDNATPDALDTIVYTIALTNAGPDDATTTTVNDLLPPA